MHTSCTHMFVFVVVWKQAIYAANWDGTVLGTVIFSAPVIAAKEAASKSRGAGAALP